VFGVSIEHKPIFCVEALEIIMKKHLSALVFGALGLLTGFVLTYVFLVMPERNARNTPKQPQLVVLTSGSLVPQPHGKQPVLPHDYLIEPTLPPRIIEK
jgi:hypothetical protein